MIDAIMLPAPDAGAGVVAFTMVLVELPTGGNWTRLFSSWPSIVVTKAIFTSSRGG
ncbi:hypothetical protein LCGC14_3114690 [marine sediment metagenome]|uniref:Uncharacterized protein n=1 Tax=marine sediment metagenome TaxID=412755 RepID=A0A0F8WT25_9ZZZZ